jgi:subtilisin family serine protease
LTFLLGAFLAIASASAGPRTSVLVHFRGRPDLSAAASLPDRGARRAFVVSALTDEADRDQAAVREDLRRRGVAFRPHFLSNVIELEADDALAAELAARPEISAVAPNRGYAPVPAPPVALVPRAAADVEPNIVKIGATDLWQRGFTGQGIVVGVADTGFEWTHPALIRQYRGWDGAFADHSYNWHDAVHDDPPANPCGNDAPAPCDDQGHGTATSGLAVGDDGMGNAIGVAPGARLIGCRNMGLGTGTPARYLECFEWLLAPTDPSGAHPRPDLGADVINNSWTCPESEGCTDPNILREAVENVRAAGVAGVYAAGNTGSGCYSLLNPPAIYAAAITVGAVGLDDHIAFFSAVGPVSRDGSFRLKPDLVAPGLNVRTAAPGGTYTPTFTGTSGSAPQVAGAFALLWSALPDAAGDVDATLDALEQSAVHLTGDFLCGTLTGHEVPNHVYGWGRIDVEAAYQALNPNARLRPELVPDGNAPRTVPIRP